MEGQSSISSEVLASYAADAARAVGGVRGIVEGHLARQRGVRVLEDEERLRVELHLDLDWGASIPAVGREVQARVRDYLAAMADLDGVRVDVVIDQVG